MIQVGDVIRWRGMVGHEGVVVEVNGYSAEVCYAGQPEELKSALVRELELAEGKIDDEMQKFIDVTTAAWLRR
jgi:hypothetical protein